MDFEFWQEKWRSGHTGFHKDEVNPRLIEHLPRLGLAPGARVLVPLAGKSLDLGWLADQGLRPIGVELSPIAVAAVFAQRGVEPTWSQAKSGVRHASGGGIEMFCGDFLDLDAGVVGRCDALWDRAALIALPPTIRPTYAARCADLLKSGANSLVVTLRYDPTAMDGPPFSVTPAEVETLYTPFGRLETIVFEESQTAPENLQARGLTDVHESVWLVNGTA